MRVLLLTSAALAAASLPPAQPSGMPSPEPLPVVGLRAVVGDASRR